VRLTGSAGSVVGEDLVDHRRLGDEGDGAHRALAGRTRQRVDLKDLLKEGCPPAGGLDRRQPWGGDDRGRPVRYGGRRLVPHATGAVGIPAIIPRRDMAKVCASRGGGGRGGRLCGSASRPYCLYLLLMTDQAARLADALADRYRIDRELGAGGMTRSNLALLLTGPSRTAPCSLRSLVASC
jgi:hypothetical protein